MDFCFRGFGGPDKRGLANGLPFVAENEMEKKNGRERNKKKEENEKTERNGKTEENGKQQKKKKETEQRKITERKQGKSAKKEENRNNRKRYRSGDPLSHVIVIVTWWPNSSQCMFYVIAIDAFSMRNGGTCKNDFAQDILCNCNCNLARKKLAKVFLCT